MSIKINDKIVSIPPYLSTSWENLSALHMRGSELAIILANGKTVYIPELCSEEINLIFKFHAIFIENDNKLTSKALSIPNANDFISHIEDSTIRFVFGSTLEGIGTMMKHNPSQSEAPDLPIEILQKIEAISKIINSSDELVLPTSEPGCNCFHCQIARTINPNIAQASSESSAGELPFQEWLIEQTGDNLYLVSNCYNSNEAYHVHLGNPVGCTCGKQGCEHLLAVLKS